MNQRILELSDQALKECDAAKERGMAEYSKRFAELFVQECMRMCDEQKADYTKWRKNAWDQEEKEIYAEGEAACDVLKYKMKKHFGVEL